MMKFLGLMVLCGILSMFLGPWPFVVVIAAYLVKLVVRR
jgi:hypothetical protein